MKHILGALAGKYAGPILVVGGGMRVLSDLEALGDRNYSAVISANGHAFKIPGVQPDFIVCKDHYHTGTRKRMEPELRAHGVPIITRQFWADYRMIDWKYQGNSGLTAILVATIMGGGPIYPVGFDCYQEGTYWYDPDAKNVGRGRDIAELGRKILKVAEACMGTTVRPVSGPLCGYFEPFTPGPFTIPYREPYILSTHRAMPALRVRARHLMDLPFDRRAQILEGREFWVSLAEYENAEVRRNVKVLDSYTGVAA